MPRNRHKADHEHVGKEGKCQKHSGALLPPRTFIRKGKGTPTRQGRERRERLCIGGRLPVDTEGDQTSAHRHYRGVLTSKGTGFEKKRGEWADKRGAHSHIRGEFSSGENVSIRGKALTNSQ